MSLESRYFAKDYHYRAKFVNRCIAIIRYSPSPRRQRAYKNLVFKMMKDVVKKNIRNYLNLLSSTDTEDLPTKDELVANSYVIFDKCLDKYVLKKNYNFYFYFNKSLLRNFYKDYRQEYRRTSTSVEVTETLESVNPGFHDYSEPDTTELLLTHLNLSELEKDICRSRLKEQKTSEFLAERPDVTSSQYSSALKRIKEVLLLYKQKHEI